MGSVTSSMGESRTKKIHVQSSLVYPDTSVPDDLSGLSNFPDYRITGRDLKKVTFRKNSKLTTWQWHKTICSLSSCLFEKHWSSFIVILWLPTFTLNRKQYLQDNRPPRKIKCPDYRVINAIYCHVSFPKKVSGSGNMNFRIIEHK